MAIHADKTPIEPGCIYLPNHHIMYTTVRVVFLRFTCTTPPLTVEMQVVLFACGQWKPLATLSRWFGGTDTANARPHNGLKLALWPNRIYDLQADEIFFSISRSCHSQVSLISLLTLSISRLRSQLSLSLVTCFSPARPPITLNYILLHYVLSTS